MIHNRVFLESIGPTLIAPHARADLPTSNIVLDSFRAGPQTVIKDGYERCHGIAIVRDRP
ncbi:hypothetical protein OIU34_21605 [Pararhizobium sp. BT-229]|uniref:hypothetical protein n=1 Tax=Pararhizobium sp. BT-229 TaxID=2986923 RepID=UPI0021F750B8|nr:hypothetical protein [Pararhizobium sp. BT-229]MCV9964490.1 hypothetical protein [Pararhizobium sp. BT-229]